MKTKFIALLFLIIASDICVLAQTESQPFQFRTEPVGISKQLNSLSPKPSKREDILTASACNITSPDTPYIKVDTAYKAPEQFKTKMPKALVAPALLIAWGVSTLGNNGLYSSHQARNDLQKLTGGKGSNIDNYLVAAPYVEFGVLLLFKVKCNSDFVNTTLLLVKSEVLMLGITYALKFTTSEERPYSYYRTDRQDVPQKGSYALQSMPSAHTSEAFVAATIVYREYRYLSPWYGIGAYTLAATVGAFRMINDQHWESDVFIGAGIGMLSTNIVYATHQHRWGRNGVCFMPTYNGKNIGGLFAYQF